MTKDEEVDEALKDEEVDEATDEEVDEAPKDEEVDEVLQKMMKKLKKTSILEQNTVTPEADPNGHG